MYPPTFYMMSRQTIFARFYRQSCITRTKRNLQSLSEVVEVGCIHFVGVGDWHNCTGLQSILKFSLKSLGYTSLG